MGDEPPMLPQTPLTQRFQNHCESNGIAVHVNGTPTLLRLCSGITQNFAIDVWDKNIPRGSIDVQLEWYDTVPIAKIMNTTSLQFSLFFNSITPKLNEDGVLKSYSRATILFDDYLKNGHDFVSLIGGSSVRFQYGSIQLGSSCAISLASPSVTFDTWGEREDPFKDVDPYPCNVWHPFMRSCA